MPSFGQGMPRCSGTSQDPAPDLVQVGPAGTENGWLDVAADLLLWRSNGSANAGSGAS
jgi:hypothetical protein